MNIYNEMDTDNIISIFENDKYKLVIDYAKNATNHRDYISDWLGTIVTQKSAYHNFGDFQATNITFWLGNRLGVPMLEDAYDDYNMPRRKPRSVYDIEDDINELIYMLPIYMKFDENDENISFETKRKDPNNINYTEGYIGAIFCTKEEAKKRFKNVTNEDANEDKLKELAKKALKEDLNIYAQFLNEGITGFTLYYKFPYIYNKQEFLYYHEVDSCYGFFGPDYHNNNIVESIYLDKNSLQELLNSQTYCKY